MGTALEVEKQVGVGNSECYQLGLCVCVALWILGDGERCPAASRRTDVAGNMEDKTCAW